MFGPKIRRCWKFNCYVDPHSPQADSDQAIFLLRRIQIYGTFFKLQNCHNLILQLPVQLTTTLIILEKISELKCFCNIIDDFEDIFDNF